MVGSRWVHFFPLSRSNWIPFIPRARNSNNGRFLSLSLTHTHTLARALSLSLSLSPHARGLHYSSAQFLVHCFLTRVRGARRAHATLCSVQPERTFPLFPVQSVIIVKTSRDDADCEGSVILCWLRLSIETTPTTTATTTTPRFAGSRSEIRTREQRFFFRPRVTESETVLTSVMQNLTSVRSAAWLL